MAKSKISNSGLDRSRTLIYLLIVAVVLVFAALMIAFLGNSSQFSRELVAMLGLNKKNDQILIINQIVPSQTSKLFIKDFELWATDNSGQSKQVTSSEKGIAEISSSQDFTTISLIKGLSGTEPGQGGIIAHHSVYLYTPNNQTIMEIYKPYSVYKGFEGYDFDTWLNVAVSNNKQMVAITTAESLLIYDIKTGFTSTIFSFPVGLIYQQYPKSFPAGIDETLSPNWLGTYYAPRFSPDDSKILYTIGYWEGAGFGYVDLRSPEIKKLPFVSSYTGNNVLGWVDNDSLLIAQTEIIDEKSVYQPRIHELKIVKLDDLEKDYTVLFKGKGDMIFTRDSFDQIRQKLRYKIIDNDGNSVPYEFDLNTRQNKIL